MDFALLFASVATGINCLVAIWAFWNVRQKLTAEKYLLEVLKSADPSFFRNAESALYSLQNYPLQQKAIVKGAQDLILPLIQRLDQPFKKLLLETLYQPSEAGRAHYVLKLLLLIHSHTPGAEPRAGMSPTTA